MLHNYYLMEKDGKLSVIPWDYNLAFGGFSGAGMDGNGATSLVNTGIDSPLSGATESSRPLWEFITSNETYLNQYHEAYQALMDKMNAGVVTDEIKRIYNMIRPYVETDKSAFFTVEQFDSAVTALTSFCVLRAESITKQLSGALSAVTNSQNAADKVDASDLNVNVMGDMNSGNDKGGNFPMNMPNMQDMPDGENMPNMPGMPN